MTMRTLGAQQKVQQTVGAKLMTMKCQNVSDRFSKRRDQSASIPVLYDAEDDYQSVGSLALANEALEVTPVATEGIGQQEQLEAAWETPAAPTAMASLEQAWTTREAVAEHLGVTKHRKHSEEDGKMQEACDR